MFGNMVLPQISARGCQWANSTVANPGSTKENVAPSCATSIQLEVSMNSRNSSDLVFSSASRSTFHHTTFPWRSWIPNFTQSRRLFAHTGGLTGSPPHSKVAPLPMLNQSNEQTEDGHAMMKSDTFHSSPNLSDAVRGCHNNCRKMCTNVTTVC